MFLDNFDHVKGPVPQLLCALPRLWIPTSLKPVAIDRRAKEHVMTQAFDAHHMACTNADFHAASLTLVSGELVAESSVAPPGDGDGGEFGLAEHG